MPRRQSPVMIVRTQKAQFHVWVETMKAVNRGPKYGERITKPVQMLILRLGK
jgi:hypothetical protein